MTPALMTAGTNQQQTVKQQQPIRLPMTSEAKLIRSLVSSEDRKRGLNQEKLQHVVDVYNMYYGPPVKLKDALDLIAEAYGEIVPAHVDFKAAKRKKIEDRRQRLVRPYHRIRYA